jgi:diguanylate cyclase (GGDEF)-like protein
MRTAHDTVNLDTVTDFFVRVARLLSEAEGTRVAARIDAALEALGEELGADRAYVFEHEANGETTSNTFEWCAPGVEPQRETLQRVPSSLWSHWQARFEAGDVVAIEDVSALDPAVAPEFETLARQGIVAMLAVPLRSRGCTTGFLGLDDVRSARSWSKPVVDLLQTSATLIGATLARRTAEVANRALSQHLEAVTRQMPGTLFRFERDPDGRRRFTYTGPNFARLMGIDPAPLADDATPAIERVIGDDQAAFAAAMAESGSTLSRWEHTFRVFDANGAVRHVLGRADPSDRGDGGVVWHGMLLDISDVHQSNVALRRSEADLRSILEVSEDAVVLIDAERRVVDCNRVARDRVERLTGRELHVGDVVTEIVRDHALVDDLASAFAGSTVEGERDVVSRRDPRHRYVARVRIVPILDPDGAVRTVVLRSTDVTDQQRVEALEAREHAFRQGLLTLLTDLMARDFDDGVYQHVLDHAVATIPGAEGGSVVIARDDGRYHYVAASGFDLEQLKAIAYEPEDLAKVEPADATVVRPSYDNSHHPEETQAVLASAGRMDEIRATLVAPVDVGGKRLGYLHLDTFSDRDAFDDGAVDLARLLASTVAVALQRLTLEKSLHDERGKLQHLATHDALTGLPNRTMLADRLGQALARGSRRGLSTALLIVDLDGFKAVNDRFGHPQGDEVLRTVATRLRDTVRVEDTVVRLGGDEFAVVAGDLGRPEDAATIAEKLVDATQRPVAMGSATALLGASVGISLAPGDASNGDAMMQNADMALYRVKRDGGGGIAFFTAELDSRMRARSALTEDLRRALASDDGIDVAYQSVVRLEDRRVVGVEALARWHHPEHGPIAPNVFVPLAEESGLIGALGKRVLQRACRDLGAWRRDGIGLDWTCAVNVSALQLRAEPFAAEVEDLVTAVGISLRDLAFEVTESAVMDHGGPALANLARLRHGGARVLIDDFGTGYSSLSRLKDLPVDAVKIDRSFVVGLANDARTEGSSDAAIVDAVVALAQGLGLSLVAEGIETEAQRQALIARGCGEGQGYLFARPVSFETVRASYLSARDGGASSLG